MGGAGAAKSVTRQPNPTGDRQRVGDGRELRRHGPKPRNTPLSSQSYRSARNKLRKAGLGANDGPLDQ